MVNIRWEAHSCKESILIYVGFHPEFIGLFKLKNPYVLDSESTFSMLFLEFHKHRIYLLGKLYQIISTKF